MVLNLKEKFDFEKEYAIFERAEATFEEPQFSSFINPVDNDNVGQCNIHQQGEDGRIVGQMETVINRARTLLKERKG